MTEKKFVRVYHTGYGCDTGCCGHVVEMPDGRESQFDFMHGAKTTREQAIEYAKKVVKKEFPECFDSLDWEKTDTSEIKCYNDMA